MGKTKEEYRSSPQGKYTTLIAPIMSITIMVLGMGSLTTFTTLRLHNFGVADWLIGLISASYFIGLTIGGYKSQHLILRVGHIRSYAAFSCVFAVATLLQGLFEVPYLWIILRYAAGFSLAGCFLVVESWLLGASNRQNRGIILAIYMISYYGGQAFGQLFLKLSHIQPIEIYIIGALFFTLSILPVTITRFHAPYAEEPNILSLKKLYQTAPVAVWGTLGAGFVLSVIYSLYPLYLAYTGWAQSDVATVMAVLLVGATLGQYPVGWISDRCDRRLVIMGILLLFILAILGVKMFDSNFPYLLIASGLIGAAAFTIYPLSINHGVDYFDSKDLISASAALMLFYGVGSSIAPTIVSVLMNAKLFGKLGFIYGLLSIALVLFSVVFYRVCQPKASARISKSPYLPFPDTTVEVMQMDPDLQESDIEARHIVSLKDQKNR